MNEMIERVADVLKCGCGNVSDDYWNRLVKAAIAAMREPTEEMKAVGVASNPHLSCVEYYQLMIDTALKEETK